MLLIEPRVIERFAVRVAEQETAAVLPCLENCPHTLRERDRSRFAVLRCRRPDRHISRPLPEIDLGPCERQALTHTQAGVD